MPDTSPDAPQAPEFPGEGVPDEVWARVVRGAAEAGHEGPPPVIDTTVVHPARRYDYWLGGKTHYAVDRASGDAVAGAFPTIRTAALENRRFLSRAVRRLVTEHGITQFLDVGTGIPSPGNTHEVAQSLAPDARVLYVDNDPVVLAHARALLASGPQGSTSFLLADLRDPERILRAASREGALDLHRPVALLLVAVLHFMQDEDHPAELLQRVARALPAGSMLAFTHVTFDYMPPEIRAAGTPEAMAPVMGSFRPRTHDEVSALLEGFDVLEPGLVPVNTWHADDEPGPRPTDAETSVYGALARIP